MLHEHRTKATSTERLHRNTSHAHRKDALRGHCGARRADSIAALSPRITAIHSSAREWGFGMNDRFLWKHSAWCEAAFVLLMILFALALGAAW